MEFRLISSRFGGGKCLNGFPFSEMGISSVDGLRMEDRLLCSTSGGSFVAWCVLVCVLVSSSIIVSSSSHEDMDEEDSESMAVSPNVRKLSSFCRCCVGSALLLLIIMASIFAIETVGCVGIKLVMPQTVYCQPR